MHLSIAFDGSTPIPATLPVVDAAEDAGLDRVWSAEHVGLNDAVVPSSQYLARTRRLGVGLIGCNPDTRHPGLLAMELASLASIAAGRVRVQVGTGDPTLARLIGVRQLAPPLENVEALVTSLRDLLAGKRVAHEAPTFTLDGLQLRACEEPPKIDIMAIRPKMLALAARVGDGVALSAGASTTYLSRAVSAIEDHLGAAGRDRQSFAINAVVIGAVREDLDAARHHAAKLLAFSPHAMAEILADGEVSLPDPDEVRTAMAERGPSAAGELFAAETIDALALTATPASLGDALARYSSTGIDELTVMLSGNPSAHVETVGWLAEARTRAVAL